MSKVSIVVAIYNAERVIERCIKSLLRQTLSDIEIILVNDGSTDNTLRICELYATQDSRIKVYSKKNEGSIKTRRNGVERSSSDYIMFVDADDWIHKKMVEIMYEEIIKSESDVVVCNSYNVLGKFDVLRRRNKSTYFQADRVYKNDEVRNELAGAYFHGHPFPATLWGKIYKRNVILSSGNYLEHINFLGDDLFYNLEIFLKSKKVKVITKPLYYYRVGGLTSKYMPYLFNDIIEGYVIQKNVIDEFYVDSKGKRINGISVMLLNTFKTCLYNCFKGEFTDLEIRKLISTYVNNEYLREATYNEKACQCLENEYLAAIQQRDIEYLFELGQVLYKKGRKKTLIKNILSKVLA